MIRGLIVIGLLSSGCSKKLCEPWRSWGLPVDHVERCDDTEIHGRTSAAPADIVTKLEAHGLVAGRLVDGDYRTASSWIYFTKKGEPATALKMPARFDRDFFIERTSANFGDRWMPEATFAGLHALPAARETVMARFAPLATLFDAAGAVPARCDDAVLATDPTLAKTRSAFLVNLDSSTYTKAKPYARGPESIPPARDAHDLEHEDVHRLLSDLEQLRQAAATRFVAAIRITDYVAPEVQNSARGGHFNDTFTRGSAKFELKLIDLQTKQIVCGTKGEATSSETLAVTRSGESQYSAEAIDLALNVSQAAAVELARLSPRFKAK
ncbi:MAG: hypothetical protein ABI467_05545 [Kofleriaceae bacterium]